MNHLHVSGVVLAFVLWGGSGVCAQSDPPAPPDNPSGVSGEEGDVLAGPKVDDGAQKQNQPMGPQGTQQDRNRDVPFQRWMTVLRGLELSEEQQDAIRAIAQEFQQAQREHQASGGEDMRQLQKQAREARQAGQPLAEEIRQKIQKFEADRPKPGPYQQRIWAQLTQEQQAQAKTKLDELRAEMHAERPRRQDRQINKNQDSPPTQAMDEPPMDEDASKPLRRNARRGGSTPLDEIGQRRLRFLLSRQSAGRAGGEATPDERHFKFEDEDSAAKESPNPGQSR